MESSKNNTNEIWKPIPGYEGFYEASNLGRIRSCTRMIRRSRGGFQKHRGRVLIPTHLKSGYTSVGLSKYGNRQSHTIHTLVAKAFIGESNLVVDHINRIKSDNRLCNLRYVTQRENVIHSRTNITGKTGVYLNDHRYRKKYRARIRIGGKMEELGSYFTKEEASKAYNQRLKQLINGKHKSRITNY